MLKPLSVKYFSMMSRIFIAEDNYSDAVLLREAMRESGVDASFDVVEDGEKAIGHLRALEKTDGPYPDLIVLDLNLPRIRGHEILRFIREEAQLKDISTVIVTSSGAPADRARCASADAYYLKCSDWDDCLKLAQDLSTYLPQ